MNSFWNVFAWSILAIWVIGMIVKAFQKHFQQKDDWQGETGIVTVIEGIEIFFWPITWVLETLVPK